jgi:hypothetical protein
VVVISPCGLLLVSSIVSVSPSGAIVHLRAVVMVTSCPSGP